MRTGPASRETSGCFTVCVLIEPVERPYTWDRGIIRARAWGSAGSETEKSVVARLNSDGLADDSHERRITQGEVNAQIDRSTKANGCY